MEWLHSRNIQTTIYKCMQSVPKLFFYLVQANLAWKTYVLLLCQLRTQHLSLFSQINPVEAYPAHSFLLIYSIQQSPS